MFSFGFGAMNFKNKLNIFNKVKQQEKFNPSNSKFNKTVLDKNGYSKISLQDNFNNIILNNLKEVFINSKGEIPLHPNMKGIEFI